MDALWTTAQHGNWKLNVVVVAVFSALWIALLIYGWRCAGRRQRIGLGVLSTGWLVIASTLLLTNPTQIFIVFAFGTGLIVTACWFAYRR